MDTFNIKTSYFYLDIHGRQILIYEDDLNGYITSPGYPAYYPDKINYTWILRNNHRIRIVIKIIHMNIIHQVPCGDYLEVHVYFLIKIYVILFSLRFHVCFKFCKKEQKGECFYLKATVESELYFLKYILSLYVLRETVGHK